MVSGDQSMNKFQRIFNWLLAAYCAGFILYLFNLAAPPNNMPIFAAMMIIAVAALAFSRSRNKLGFAVFMMLVALVLIVKEHNDGVALKGKLDNARHQSQEPERR
jgi:hypothetical protein